MLNFNFKYLRRYSNLQLRLVSSIVIGFLFIISIFWLQYLFFLLLVIIVQGMFEEWLDIGKTELLLLPGVILIFVSGFSLFVGSVVFDKLVIFTYFIIIWVTDCFAFVGGKILKGPKLVPKISPQKTWSGSFCGIIFSNSVACFINYISSYKIFKNTTTMVLISLLISILAQVSDLTVSLFKRRAYVKESGSSIPGHGGYLDRFDSLLFTAPLILLYKIFL